MITLIAISKQVQDGFRLCIQTYIHLLTLSEHLTKGPSVLKLKQLKQTLEVIAVDEVNFRDFRILNESFCNQTRYEFQ